VIGKLVEAASYRLSRSDEGSLHNTKAVLRASLGKCRPEQGEAGAKEQPIEKILEGTNAHALDDHLPDK
jgi:hypothetical protein